MEAIANDKKNKKIKLLIKTFLKTFKIQIDIDFRYMYPNNTLCMEKNWSNEFIQNIYDLAKKKVVNDKEGYLTKLQIFQNSETSEGILLIFH